MAGPLGTLLDIDGVLCFWRRGSWEVWIMLHDDGLEQEGTLCWFQSQGEKEIPVVLSTYKYGDTDISMDTSF